MILKKWPKLQFLLLDLKLSQNQTFYPIKKRTCLFSGHCISKLPLFFDMVLSTVSVYVLFRHFCWYLSSKAQTEKCSLVKWKNFLHKNISFSRFLLITSFSNKPVLVQANYYYYRVVKPISFLGKLMTISWKLCIFFLCWQICIYQTQFGFTKLG